MKCFHFIPADKPKYYSNPLVVSSNILLDFEDGIDIKNAHRALQIFQEHQHLLPEQFFVRLNPDLDPIIDMALANLINPCVNIGLVLPKIRTINDIDRYSSLYKIRSKKIIILIEDFYSFEDLKIIASNYKNIEGVGLGLEDILASLVVSDEELKGFVSYIKQRFVFDCLSLGLVKIAPISKFTSDIPGFAQICLTDRCLGFDGKFSIHPEQIKQINTIFRVDKTDYDWAISIKEKTDNFENSGYRIIGGSLITPPMIKKAKNILLHKEKEYEQFQ